MVNLVPVFVSWGCHEKLARSSSGGQNSLTKVSARNSLSALTSRRACLPTGDAWRLRNQSEEGAEGERCRAVRGPFLFECHDSFKPSPLLLWSFSHDLAFGAFIIFFPDESQTCIFMSNPSVSHFQLPVGCSILNDHITSISLCPKPQSVSFPGFPISKNHRGCLLLKVSS